jgi:hypothetical protein
MTDFDDLSPGYQEVVKYLQEAKLANPKQVASATDRSDKAARVMLIRMFKDGVVVRPLRGHYCLPGLAEELDLPVESGRGESSDSEDSDRVEAVSNPLTGSTSPDQKSMGFEEGRRRSNVAKVAKTLLDAKDAKDSGDEDSGVEFSGKVRAKRHPWWPMRMDLRARIRWWIAEKLANGIVALISKEELPAKDEVYYGS